MSCNRAIVLTVVAAAAFRVGFVQAAESPWASKPPESVYWPGDSGYINVKDLGAKGDGVTDDTAAIKAAYATKGGAIYFPAGTYLVSDTILASPKRYFIQGDGPAKTVVRLKDNCPGFGDPAKPKAVLQNWDQEIGKGNNGQAFRNSFHDLAVDVGRGNAGAIGIMYFTNNQGTIENVVVRSSDPDKAGRAGIAMAQNWPGPALFRHVRIEGFDDGIWSIIHQYSFTLEHVTLTAQRHAGIHNRGQKLFIRGLASKQSEAPALLADSGTIVVLDSELTGSGPAAIDNKAQFFARNVKTAGYALAIRSAKGGNVPGGAVKEFSSNGYAMPFATEARSLELAVEEAPYSDAHNGADWVSVAKFGAKPGDGADDTAGIQAAIDSGARVVYFPRGGYDINGTVRVRGKVERIVMMESGLATGSAKVPNWNEDAPVFRIEDGQAPFVIIEKFEGNYGTKRTVFEHATTRPLALRTLIPRGTIAYKNTVPGGRLFLDDFCAGEFVFDNQAVYCRQLNPENMGTKILVKGGSFWVLGLKTEKAGKIVEVVDGGKAEILGGYIYRNRGKQIPADHKGPEAGTSPDAFYNHSSSMCVLGISGDGSVQETQKGQTKTGSTGGGVYVGRPR